MCDRAFCENPFNPFLFVITLSAPTQQNGQTHSSNLSAVC